MSKQDFEASKAKGHHARLARMAGEWEGRFRLWFQPGDPVCDERQAGSLRLVLDGRFLLHEYRSAMNGEPIEGLAIYGAHLGEGNFESAWIESFGMGTGIMFSTGALQDARFDALGSYGAGPGEPRWGWRTQIEQPDDDRLLITMYNIKPGDKETRAVEVDYRRVSR